MQLRFTSGIPDSTWSKAVACSQFLGQLKQILPYYTSAFYSGDSSHRYEMDVTLADKFGNVSNLDPPVSLSVAEVAYESDVLNGGYITQNQPFSSAIETDVQVLATACGLVEITGTWVPSPSPLSASSLVVILLVMGGIPNARASRVPERGRQQKTLKCRQTMGKPVVIREAAAGRRL